jgi:hypothetical protein
MEVSGEGGGSVGGRVVGRLEGWGRYEVPKNKIGVRGGAKKNMIKKKLSQEKNNLKGLKRPRRK